MIFPTESFEGAHLLRRPREEPARSEWRDGACVSDSASAACERAARVRAAGWWRLSYNINDGFCRQESGQLECCIIIEARRKAKRGGGGAACSRAHTTDVPNWSRRRSSSTQRPAARARECARECAGCVGGSGGARERGGGREGSRKERNALFSKVGVVTGYRRGPHGTFPRRQSRRLPAIRMSSSLHCAFRREAGGQIASRRALESLGGARAGKEATRVDAAETAPRRARERARMNPQCGAATA